MAEYTDKTRSLLSPRRVTEGAGYIFDKIQPQARDMEEAVLGSMLLDKEAVAFCIDILKPESFYDPANQEIYRAILDLFGRAKPVDILTVTEQLRKNGQLDAVGGPFYLSQLTSRIGSTANVEHHARVIAEKYLLREMIVSSNMILKDAYEETTDVFDLLDRAEQSLFNIAEKNLRRGTEPVNEVLAKALKQLESLKDSNTHLTGVPSGFNQLDQITGGWQKSDLVVIAARPAMGKTAFILSMARNASVDFKKPVAVFSLEMSSVQLVNRLISAEAEIDGEKLKKGNLEEHEWFQLTQKINKLSEAKLFIDDTPAINIFELRAKCRRLKLQHDIQMVIIDYLQIMGTTAQQGKGPGNREQEISYITRNLKTLAKELDVPVIVLSQLNRSVETNAGDKKPQLHHLRESGSIEQDADMVLFLYRAEYYKITEDPISGLSTQGMGEVIIAKHRNGALGSAYLRFISKYAKFDNLELNLDPEAQFSYLKDEVITVQSKLNTDDNLPNFIPDPHAHKIDEEPPF